MRDRTWQRRITVFLAVLLSVAIGGTSIFGLLSQNATTSSNTIPPTETSAPTLPAPVSDLSSVNFDRTYLHPSGLFTAAVPTGYTPDNDFSNPNEAQVALRNESQLSVIDMRIIRPTEDISIETPDDLNAIFNDTWLRQSWQQYRNPQVEVRRVEGDQHIMDFTVQRGGQEFIARQIAFFDETWVYAVRVVTPGNASEYLQYVLENQAESFTPVERYTGEPLAWRAYFDPTADHMIRYPGTWRVVDSAPGAPASITGEGVELRVETANTTIDSTDVASAYVEGLGAGISALSVEEIDQYGTAGYAVSYQETTVDGDTSSGAVYILNGEDTTHIANLLLTTVPDADLLSDDASDSYSDAVNTLQSFSLFPELDVQFIGTTEQVTETAATD